MGEQPPQGPASQQPNFSQQPNQPQGTSAAAIAGLVLGIVALLGSIIPILNNIAFFIAIVGLVFAIIGLAGVLKGKRAGKGLAIAALIICVIAGALVIGSQSLYSDAIDAATEGTSFSTSEDDGKKSDEGDAKKNEAKADYTIKGAKASSTSYGTFQVKGSLTNNIDSDWSYVSVSYSLYDKKGNKIDTANDYCDGLKSGKTWKFEASSLSAESGEVDTYELDEVSYW